MMTVAIEAVRVEHCFLPLYRGGTRITVKTPPFATADLEFTILPADPNVRALVRALDAGTSAEASAVSKDVVNKHLADALSAGGADPWVAMLVGLLSIRFPDIFPPIDPAWAASLVRRAGWAFDTYVIQASQLLSAARGKDMEAQNEAVAHMVSVFADAEDPGSTYYRYSNQLFAGTAAGITDYLKENALRVDPAAAARFSDLYSRWRRKLSLQRGAGPTFALLAPDFDLSEKRQVLVPYRRSSGSISRRDSLVVFAGELRAGKITLLHASSGMAEQEIERAGNATGILSSEDALKTRLPDLPALTRAIRTPEDPNKNRFGGEARSRGVSLTASFEPTKSSDWVTIALTVKAEDSVQLGFDDFVWFVLHPTFSPPAVKVFFRGSRAQLRIQAWGGFTVGVWIAKLKVELECDLAHIEGAPWIIRNR
jgi:hypothetical protein